MFELDHAAPAPPETPPTPTVADTASQAGDVAAYREARQAERTGKPLPVATEAVSAGVALAPPAEEVKAVSKRQQAINDSVRAASEKAVADAVRDKDAEIARLRAHLAPRQEPLAPRQAPVAAPQKFPDYATFLQTSPEASLEAWMDARDEWRDQQRERTTHERVAQQQETVWHKERVDKFAGQLETARTADPAFSTKLSPDVAGLEPAAIAIAAGRPLTVNNAIAEEILDSPIAPQLMLHLSANPDALQHLREARTPRELARRVGALERGLDSPGPAPATTFPKTMSSAPPPATTLRPRPSMPADPEGAAVATGDVQGYRAIRRMERQSQRVS